MDDDIPFLTFEVRRLIERALPDAELLCDRGPVYRYRSGAHEVCVLWPLGAHLTLGFARGDSLYDRHGLLRGKGCGRHVVLSREMLAQGDAIGDLLRAAWDDSHCQWQVVPVQSITAVAA